MQVKLTLHVQPDPINGPINDPIKLTERQELILQMFAEDKCLSIGRLCEKTGLSVIRLDSLPGGRASLALPRAILRVTKEKAGAGMCRLGFFGVNIGLILHHLVKFSETVKKMTFSYTIFQS